MKLSKLSITFALVVSVHVALLGVILLQPGCKNNANAPIIVSAEQTAAPTGVMQPPSSAEPPPAAEPEFQPPTRPTWTETAEAQPLENVGDSAPEVAAVSTYTVQRGDSLSRIAKKHGVTVAALAAANNLDTKALLRLGQSLVVPAPSKRAAAAPAEAVLDIPAGESASYVVAKGDSLSKIAAKHGTSVRALQSLNKLSSTTIRVGQKLRVPKAGAVAAPAAEKKAAAVASGNTYKIVAGDTLGGIAKKHGVKLAALQTANPGVDSARLRIGQTIAIPSGATSAPAAPAAPAPAPATASVSEAPAPEAPVAPVAPVAPEAPVAAPEAIPEAPVVPATDAAAVPEAPVVPAATLNE